jgi:NADH-quinone oxidoreductase subunit H
MTQVLAILVLFLFLLGGIALAGVLDRAVPALVAGRSLQKSLVDPFTIASSFALAQASETERPDRVNWILAPILYFTLAAIGLSIVPFAPGVVVGKSYKVSPDQAFLGRVDRNTVGTHFSVALKRL